MSEYTISQITPSDRRACRQMDALLEKEGIERDKNLDYSIGLVLKIFQIVLKSGATIFHKNKFAFDARNLIKSEITEKTRFSKTRVERTRSE